MTEVQRRADGSFSMEAVMAAYDQALGLVEPEAEAEAAFIITDKHRRLLEDHLTVMYGQMGVAVA